MLDTTRILWYSTLAVQSLFCLYLIWTQLAKSYPTFTASLGAGVLRSLAAMYFMQGAAGARLPLSYTYFWLWSEPFWLLLQVAVVLEVHAKIWKEHTGILRQMRQLLLFTLVTALVAAGLPLRHEAARAASSQIVLLMHFGIQATRYISSVLAIFLVLSALLFVAVVGNKQSSNVFRHEGMMAAYFAIYATAACLIDIGWVRTTLVNGYFVSAITLCFVAWFSAFQPRPLPTE
jgi:putative effector of murein hydrolase LrgA (UPF0299 family)